MPPQWVTETGRGIWDRLAPSLTTHGTTPRTRDFRCAAGPSTDVPAAGAATTSANSAGTVEKVPLGQGGPAPAQDAGQGVLYSEPLAKTDSADEVQIYREIGLEYTSAPAGDACRSASTNRNQGVH